MEPWATSAFRVLYRRRSECATECIFDSNIEYSVLYLCAKCTVCWTFTEACRVLPLELFSVLESRVNLIKLWIRRTRSCPSNWPHSFVFPNATSNRQRRRQPPGYLVQWLSPLFSTMLVPWFYYPCRYSRSLVEFLGNLNISVANQSALRHIFCLPSANNSQRWRQLSGGHVPWWSLYT